MGITYQTPEVDPNGASEVTLRTSTGVELLGTKVCSSSIPVAIASDQAPIPVSGIINSGLITANQGIPATISNRWPIQLTDGTDLHQIDSSGASVDIDLIHYLTHQGLYFYFQDYASGIGNGATRDVLIITANNGKQIHARLNFGTLGGTYILYEAPTTTANGTSLTILNRNRTSANTATLTAFSVPTVTATGTQLVVALLGATTRSSNADILNCNEEIILKPNTKYLIRYTASTGNNSTTTGLSFYEV